MTIRAVRRMALSCSAAAAASCLLIGGIVELGALAQESIASDNRYSLPVREIECNPPPDQDRSGFLDEVYYYGQLPKRVTLLDADLHSRLTRAFRQHPKVRDVVGVTITSTRGIRVDLSYRE